MLFFNWNVEMKLEYIEEGFKLKIGEMVIKFTKYEQNIDNICICDHPATLVYLYNEMAIEFIEKMEELENPFDANEIDKNLYYPNEDISKKLESKKETDDIKISKKIRELSFHQRNFKATIKNRIKENNGQRWIKDFSKNYYWEDVLNHITRFHRTWEITPVLEKYKKTIDTP